MELSYFVVIGLSFVVVITEAKLFIGDCSYGFCEQNCKQIKEFEMECYCKRGYTLKQDGRKCLKSFIDDDEISGDGMTSGEEIGNCDNEDGNCDKSAGTEIYISGDDEEGSGDTLSSIIKKLALGTTSIKAIHSNISSTLSPQVKTVYSITKSKSISVKTAVEVPVKVLVTPTKIIKPASTHVGEKYAASKTTNIDNVPKVTKIPPVIEETVKTYTKILHTLTRDLVKIINTQIDKKEISTSSVKRIIATEKSKDIVGIVKPPLLLTPSETLSSFLKTSIVVSSSQKTSSSKKLSDVKTIHEVPLPLPRETSTLMSASPKALPSSRKPSSVSTVHEVPLPLPVTSVQKVPLPLPHKTSTLVSSLKKTLSSSRRLLDVNTIKEVPLPLSTKHTREIVIKTSEAEEVKPVVTTTELEKPKSATISKSYVTPDIATRYVVIDKKLQPAEEKSSIYEYIPVKPVASTIRVKQPSIVVHKSKTSIVVEKSRTVTKSIVPTTQGFIEIKKVVVQDDTDDTPEYPIVFNKSKASSSVVLRVETSPDVTIPVPDKKVPTATPSIGVHKKIVPLNISRMIGDLPSPTKIIKTVDKILPVVKDSITTIVKDTIVKPKIHTSDSSVVRVSKTAEVEIRQLKKTISSLTPKSSFIVVSSSGGIIEKTTPLQVIRTHTVATSSSSLKLLRKATSVVKEVGKTDVIIDRDVIKSTSSTRSVEKSKTLVKLDVKKSSSKLIPKEVSTSSSVKRKAEESEKVEVIQSSPTRTTKETRRVVIVIQESQGGSDSFGCTLVVNKYLLTLGALFTIYFLRV